MLLQRQQGQGVQHRADRREHRVRRRVDEGRVGGRKACLGVQDRRRPDYGGSEDENGGKSSRDEADRVF